MQDSYYADLIADHAHTLERLCLRLSAKLSRNEPVTDMESALVRDRIRHIVAVAETLFPDMDAARPSLPSPAAPDGDAR